MNLFFIFIVSANSRESKGAHTEASSFQLPSNFSSLKPQSGNLDFSGLNPYRTQRKKIQIFVLIRKGELSSGSGTGKAKPGPDFCHP